MKRNLALLLGGLVLFIFIFVTSIAWSKIFYGETKGGEEVSVLNMKISNDGVLDTTQEVPLGTPNSSVEPYTFTVTNTSQKDSHYQILLEEDPVSNKEGYREEELLKRSQLNYELTLNGNVIQQGRLSEIKKNVLDEKIIQGKKENAYSLKIWVHDEVQTGEWENKYYHYKVKMKVIGE